MFSRIHASTTLGITMILKCWTMVHQNRLEKTSKLTKIRHKTKETKRKRRSVAEFAESERRKSLMLVLISSPSDRLLELLVLHLAVLARALDLHLHLRDLGLLGLDVLRQRVDRRPVGCSFKKLITTRER